MAKPFPFDSRRAIRVLEPAVQLRLPIYLMLATLLFVTVFAWNGWAAFRRLVELTLAESPEIFIGTVWEQAGAFLIVSAAILSGYLSVVAGVCLAYTHRLIGPRVALERQIEALKNGDYAARVKLRKYDVVFRDLARDLNELAQVMERDGKSHERRSNERLLSFQIQ